MEKGNSKKALSMLLVAFVMLAMIPMLATPVKGATEEEIENAIANGLAYLAGRQFYDGSWGPWVGHADCPAYTGLVLLKLEDRAYELCYDSPFDPTYAYSSNVTKGWEYLFSVDEHGNPIYAKKQTISNQDHTGGASGTVDNPDTNGNGYGIYFDGIHAVYETGIILMALVDSGTPNRLNDGGIDYDGDGNVDTFKEIAQDVVDWLAYAQGDLGNDEGGYGYAALNNAGGSTDNSNAGYAYLGLAAAEATTARHAPKAEAFACTVPGWVKTELGTWITTIQDPQGPIGDQKDGGSWYNPDLLGNPWCNELKTGNLIFEMTFYGDIPGVARFDNAIDYIERHWKDPNLDPGWGFGQNPANYQAIFCLMKSFEYSGIDAIDLDGDTIPEHDWFAEFATVLVNQQSTVDGSWTGYWLYGTTVDARKILGTVWALLTLEKTAPQPVRTIDKKVFKKVKVIPAPVQFWREFIGGVTDIIVFDPPETIEPVALVREYAVLHYSEEPIPLELLTWDGTEGLPWKPIDTPEEPYILPPDGIVEYDIPTLESDTAVLVRYTVAWASSQDIIETHFINEAILESRSPQVIVGQLTNFDVHNDYHEPVDNFELELYGIQPSDVIDWFPGWGTPPQITSLPPSGGLPRGTEIVWMDPMNPVMPCHWEHFGLHLKPGVIAEGIKAYWTQTPSAELGDVIYTKIRVTVPSGETVTVVDTLPSELSYLTGTFTVDGVSATPTITKNTPPPPIITELSYTLATPETHLIAFKCKVDTAYWEDREVCNVATATWYDEEGEVIETKEEVECFTIHAFEELNKSIHDGGVCDGGDVEYLYVDGYEPWIETGWTNPGTSLLGVPDGDYAESFADCSMTSMYTFEDIDLAGRVVKNVELEAYSKCEYTTSDIDSYIFTYDESGNPVMEWAWADSQGGTTDWAWTNKHYYGCMMPEYYGDHILTEQGINSAKMLIHNYGGGSMQVDAYRLKVEFDPLTIKAETETQWAVVMEVTNPFSYTMKNVTITDNFSAELEIDQVMTSPDTNWDGVLDIFDLSRVAMSYGARRLQDPNRYDHIVDINNDGFVDARDLAAVTTDYGLTLWLTGRSEKVHLFWYIGDLPSGKTARITILVSTDLNPAGHQEYTEPGIYELNSGATLKFIDPEQNMQLSAVTDSIYVTVLPDP